MIIDIHTHTFPEKIAASTIDKLAHTSHTRPYSNGTSAGLQSSMAQAGVDCSVILPVATNTRQVSRVNDSSAQINEHFSETGILSLGCIHPDLPDWKEELDRIAALGMKGIKIHPVYQGVAVDDPRYLRIFDRCGQLGLTVVAHAGLDIGFPGEVKCSPAMFLNAIRQVGPVKLVLAHMGGWRNWDEVEELLVETEVCLDTSYALGEISDLDDHFSPEERLLMSEEQFVRMVRKFGAHRICFGTDSPWGGQRENLAMLRALPLTAEELGAILGGNAQRILGI